MGFLGDIKKLKQQGKELNKTFDPGAMSRDAVEKMKALNESMEQTTKAMTDGVKGTAQVLSVGMTAGTLNFDPMLPVELLVTAEGGMPRPVSLQLVVPVAQVARVYVGATLPVLVSAADPSFVAVDWEAPVF